MAAPAAASQLVRHTTGTASPTHPFTSSASIQLHSRRLGFQNRVSYSNWNEFRNNYLGSHSHEGFVVSKASGKEDNLVAANDDDDEEGVSLGTMKLPIDTDIPRFESLLFQWANSLCQGANLPLPVPLKVDKIKGGVRLGFITIGDGKTEVPVYIDCLVFPAGPGSRPIFRAIRNGALKDKAPPGEPRIMRGLLQALQTSVEIARA